MLSAIRPSGGSDFASPALRRAACGGLGPSRAFLSRSYSVTGRPANAHFMLPEAVALANCQPVTQGDTGIASYAYDARGRRKTKTVGGTTTVYATDVDN